MHTIKKWVLSVLVALIIIGTAAVSFSVLLRTNTPTPSFQVVNVSISKPTIRDTNHLVFYGYVRDICSFYYTASESVTYVLVLNNPNSPSKFVNLTRFTDDSEIIDTMNIPPLATQQRSYDLLKGQTFSGQLSILGGENDLHLYINYHNYTQSIDFSFNLVNTGSSDGFVVVELRSDGTSVWSNRYYLEARGNEGKTGTVTIPDKEDHAFSLIVVEQGR